MKYLLMLLPITFFGSVFITSEKFVDTTIASKFYFSLIAASIGIIAITVGINKSNFNSTVQKLTSLSIQKGLFVVGVLQALYGILQYSGKYPSNHYAFSITGSFDNPAGFVAILSLLLPIGVHWSIKSKHLERLFVLMALGVIVCAIILSGSRTGILGCIISMALILFLEFRLLTKIKHLKHVKLMLPVAAIVIVLGLFFLFKLKQDSANGRLLIWKVTSEMLADRPLFGFGYNGFQANYMDYQAHYFAAHPESNFKQLADNISHPFNEFIKVAADYGIVGLMVLSSLIGLIIWKASKISIPTRSTLVATYANFVVLSSFSYPFQYPPVWFLFVYFTFILFSGSINTKILSPIGKVVVIAICTGTILLFTFEMTNEIKWKSIADKSLQGDTKQVLPQYKKLHSHLNHNPFFLYNYGAELNQVKRYDNSILILNECEGLFNDYDLQMLLADNYKHTGKFLKAIQKYQYASQMIPNRFLPLYKQLEVYTTMGEKNKATALAHHILEKEVKVKSPIVSSIKKLATDYLNNDEP